MTNTCEVCRVDFNSKKPARTCSAKCRVTLNRQRVTHNPNVTLAEPSVTHDVTFKFKIIQSKDPKKYMESKNQVREAKYWYDVPVAALPILQKDWPKMPNYMDGRQYFLWWKNEFAVNGDPTKGELGQPIINNPFTHG